MSVTFICHMLLLYTYVSFAENEIQRHFEFADAEIQSGNVTAGVSIRSEAFKGKTLNIVDEAGLTAVKIKFSIIPYDNSDAILYVDDIRYSNDGSSDTLTLYIDNVKIGEFATFQKSKWGYAWNVFRNSGAIGPVLSLSKGNHTLEIIVQTDIYGVELDNIRLNVENHKENTALFFGATVDKA